MTTLTTIQFRSLSKHQKEDVVSTFGVYLMAYRSSGTRYTLYQLSSFYVEMIYNLKGEQALVKINVHATPDTIGNYLEKVNIKDLGF